MSMTERKEEKKKKTKKKLYLAVHPERNQDRSHRRIHHRERRLSACSSGRKQADTALNCRFTTVTPNGKFRWKTWSQTFRVREGETGLANHMLM